MLCEPTDIMYKKFSAISKFVEEKAEVKIFIEPTKELLKSGGSATSLKEFQENEENKVCLDDVHTTKI